MKQKAENLQKIDERNFIKSKEEALNIKKENLIVKQNNERNVYKQRLMSDYEEMKKIKQDELDKLIVKFKNKKLELELRQKREKNLTGNENLRKQNAYASNLTNMTMINAGGNGMNRTMTKTGLKFSLDNLIDIKFKHALPDNINFSSNTNIELKNKDILKDIDKDDNNNNNYENSQKEILVNNKKNIDASPIKKSESKKDTSKSPIRGNNNSNVNKSNKNNDNIDNNNNYSSNISIQNVAKNKNNKNSNLNSARNKNISWKSQNNKEENNELIESSEKNKENFKKKPLSSIRRSSQIKNEGDKSNLSKRVLEFKEIKYDESSMNKPNKSLRGDKELVFRENTSHNNESNTKGNFNLNQSINQSINNNLNTYNNSKFDAEKILDEPMPIELNKKKFKDGK